MAITNADGIVTPDEENVLDPEVYLAAMAASISQGIGARLAEQEAVVGLKAGIDTPARLFNAVGTVAPYTMISGVGCFVEGIEFTGGVATVIQPGIYYVSASAAIDPWNALFSPENIDRSIALQIVHNGQEIRNMEIRSDELYWQTAQSDCLVRCVAGDTLYVTWYSATHGAEGPGAKIASSAAMNTLSIGLITPTSVV